MINGKVFFFWFQMRVLLIKDHLTEPLSKEITSLFPATQLAIQLQTLHGRKLAVQGCCIKERRTVFITYKERLLEIMRVQLGMELEKNLMLLPQSLYTVSGFLQFLFICSLRKLNSIPTGRSGFIMMAVLEMIYSLLDFQRCYYEVMWFLNWFYFILFNWYIFLVEWVNEISVKSSIDWIRNSYFRQTVGAVISIITCGARVPNQENFKHTSSTKCLVVVKKKTVTEEVEMKNENQTAAVTSVLTWDQALFSFCFVKYIPVGKAKWKENLIQTFYETSSTHFFDWLTFAKSANQK